MKALLGWLKPEVRLPEWPVPVGSLLNLGCGNRFHSEWVNVDLASNSDHVRAFDLRRGLPFADNRFRAVYHSHVLEHLKKDEAPQFLKACWRVLQSGGHIRVVVPDLERIARLYLQCLEAATAGDRAAANRYDWIVLELMDQMVREQSGGAMLEYWRQDPMPAEEFVFERLGDEVRSAVAAFREQKAGSHPKKTSSPLSPTKIASFRQSGESHKWMYDRWSLGQLLLATGFVDVRVCRPQESAIGGFARYGLDVAADGRVRKPDSLFMEGRKP